MKRGVSRRPVAVLCALFVACPEATVAATPHPSAPVRLAPRPLPGPPTLPLVRLDVARDHVIVIEDLLLPRGAWTGGDLDAFVAFGAPGVPRAIDAHLARPLVAGEVRPPSWPLDPVPIDRAMQRPSSAHLLLGTSTMAGAVLHLRDAAFRRATEGVGAASLRVRMLLDAPEPDVRTGHEVVIRLGSYNGEPYALGAIEVASDEPSPWVSRAEARLCGPDADPYPLSVRVVSRAAVPVSPFVPTAAIAPVAPVLSVRHASDDLCVRYWTVADP
jgi:hypothetical protein